MGAAWGRREGSRAWGLHGVGVRAALARVGVGAAWERSECCVGAVRGWHGSDARAAPEVRFEGCTF